MHNVKTETTLLTRRGNCLRWCWLAVAVIILDQVVKFLMNSLLQLYQPQPILPFFNFTLMHNSGAAFSFLSQSNSAIYLFSAVALIAAGVILYWLYKMPATQRMAACGLALILGGALGNLVDRIIYGYVIDFFDFYIGNWHFAAFNVADAAISIGAALLVLDVFFLKKGK